MRKQLGKGRPEPPFSFLDDDENDGITRETVGGRFHISTGAIKTICIAVITLYVLTLVIIFPEQAFAIKDLFAGWTIRGGIFN